MKNRNGATVILVLTLMAVWISFPFFRIRYFESSETFKLIYSHFILPIFILSITGATILYIKYFRKYNKRTNSNLKVAFQHIITVTFLSFISLGILTGLTFSTIVTTNAYLKSKRTLFIKERVIDYETSTTKFGRRRHHILIKNPIDSSLIHLEVYRKYSAGEMFIKEMEVGRWGFLYSIN
jgi:hypothetical protein